MKKLNAKIAFLGILSLLAVGTVTTSCSKSDNEEYEEPKGSIDVAVGTFKGKLVETEVNNKIWYDAIVIVTKEGNNKLKATPKSGEAYSHLTPKTFTVESETIYDADKQSYIVNSLPGSLEGYFYYYAANKVLEISTDEQAASDIHFRFDGIKQ